ncbi:PsbP-like protein 1 [Quillaja saponaria]|uniref:PsbP-like protein 1 n=1 Tax=Quillaja saponaria TaxID=32244 RepID=A0AAD7Q6M9_QUISA|nr:PsbP-like protein 1 [Quillaja saponaria]
MATLQHSPSIHRTLSLRSTGPFVAIACRSEGILFVVKAEQASASSTWSLSQGFEYARAFQYRTGKRQGLAIGLLFLWFFWSTKIPTLREYLPNTKQDIREFGSAQKVAETSIKKVLAPPTQKTKLIEASECSMKLMGKHITDLSSLLRLQIILAMPSAQYLLAMVNSTLRPHGQMRGGGVRSKTNCRQSSIPSKFPMFDMNM